MNTKKYGIGIDLGGTKIAVGICEESEILKKVIFPTKLELGFEGVVSTIISAAEKILEEYDPKNIAGIGIGAAGQVDSETGVVLYAPNLNWNNAPLGSRVSEGLKLKVKVTNDVRAATLAEMKYGGGKGLSSFVNVFIGTGIGAGFVINGALVNGATNSAGEIGHVCLNPDGPICGCGKRGCLEAYSSGTGVEAFVKNQLKRGRSSIISDMVEGNIDAVRGPIIGKAAEKGDKLALDALKRMGRHLGVAFANLHTLINPEVILIGGGMMAMKQYFIKHLTDEMKEHILPVAMGERELVKEAHFQNDAVLLGGASMFA